MTDQQTLTGDVADSGREHRGTMLWCEDCNTWLLRSDRYEHPHELVEDSSDNEDEEEEPERIGSWYDIEVSYSATYSFRIPAWSDHEAEELAKEWHWGEKPADEHHVHTDKWEVEVIMSDDSSLPDDYDQYGKERLVDAIERGKEEEDKADG